MYKSTKNYDNNKFRKIKNKESVGGGKNINVGQNLDKFQINQMEMLGKNVCQKRRDQNCKQEGFDMKKTQNNKNYLSQQSTSNRIVIKNNSQQQQQQKFFLPSSQSKKHLNNKSKRENYYYGRLTTKDYYKNNTNEDIFNRTTSPLEIWKTIEKKYKKEKTEQSVVTGFKKNKYLFQRHIDDRSFIEKEQSLIKFHNKIQKTNNKKCNFNQKVMLINGSTCGEMEIDYLRQQQNLIKEQDKFKLNKQKNLILFLQRFHDKNNIKQNNEFMRKTTKDKKQITKFNNNKRNQQKQEQNLLENSIILRKSYSCSNGLERKIDFLRKNKKIDGKTNQDQLKNDLLKKCYLKQENCFLVKTQNTELDEPKIPILQKIRSTQIKTNTQQDNIQKVQQHNQQPKLPQKQGQQPPQSSNQNQILLLHKQPLQDYMSTFFNPIINKITSPINKTSSKNQFVQILLSNSSSPNNYFSKLIRNLFRCKSKKLTARKTQNLNKINANLFEEKSRKNLFFHRGQKGKKVNQTKKGQNVFFRHEIEENKQNGNNNCQISSINKNYKDNKLDFNFAQRKNNKFVNFLNHPKLTKNDSNSLDKSSLKETEIVPITQGRNLFHGLEQQPSRQPVSKPTQQNPAHYTPSINKNSATSSVISFGEQSVPFITDNVTNNSQMFHNQTKCRSVINAW